MDYSSLSTDKLNELKKQNSEKWWEYDDGSGLQKTQEQNYLHDQNMLITAELDKRNNTTTTYDTFKGTYSDPQANPNKAPAYLGSKYDTMIDDAYNAIVNRGKFDYNINNDSLYQQYADQYTRMGKLAMEDTMGQAAGLTGGYGSTYGQNVGQQAYNSYLQELNNIVPQLEQRAYDRWKDEGDELYNQYGLLLDRENTAYNRYRDAVTDYYNNEDRMSTQAKNLIGLEYELSPEQAAAIGMTEEQRLKYNESLKAPVYTGPYTPPKDTGTKTPLGDNSKTSQSVIDSISYADRMLTDSDAKKSAITKIIYNSIGNGTMTESDADKYMDMYDITEDFYNANKR